MIGKIFRLPENLPLSLSLKFAHENKKVLPARRGKPQNNLYDLIVKVFRKAGYSLDEMNDFYHLQE